MTDSQKENDVDILFSWQVKIPSLFHNPPLFKNLFLALVVPGPILFFLIGLFAAGPTGALSFALTGLVIGGALFILSLIISFVVTRGDVGYIVTSKEVRFIAGEYIKKLDRAVIIGGAAGGSLTTTGSGLLATSREDETFSWGEAHTIRIYGKHGIIIMRRRSRFAPMGIYTTKENFEQIKQTVLKNCPNARVKET